MKNINWGPFIHVLSKMPRLFGGFILVALGLKLMLTANIGMNPWGTFTSGLVNITPLSYGTLSQLIGLIIIASTLPMKIKLGVGTLFNMYFIGLFVDMFRTLSFIQQPDHFFLQLLMNVGGLIVFSFGVYFYLSCGLGAGPRDGLMIALLRVTGKSITIVKPAMEITVTVLGIFLGATLGIGTLVIALLGGKILDMIFKAMDYDPKIQNHQTILELITAMTPRKPATSR